MCRVLKVSEAGYYKSLRSGNKPPKHAALLAQIHEILKEDPENWNYGVRRIYLALKLKYGYEGSYSTVNRICHANGLIIRRKRRPNGITHADAAAQKSENLIQQDFTAERPNEKWLTDITEVSCADGKLYLAPVFDCYDGAIVGFQTDDNRAAELCVRALENALRKTGARGMILHSDRGSQYTSGIFRETLKKYDITQSMSGVGRCYDNARMESFFATLKKEELYGMDLSKMKISEVRSVIHRFIAYYNLRRIYTPNGGLPPFVMRRRWFEAHAAA